MRRSPVAARCCCPHCWWCTEIPRMDIISLLQLAEMSTPTPEELNAAVEVASTVPHEELIAPADSPQSVAEDLSRVLLTRQDNGPSPSPVQIVPEMSPEKRCLLEVCRLGKEAPCLRNKENMCPPRQWVSAVHTGGFKDLIEDSYQKDDPVNHQTLDETVAHNLDRGRERQRRWRIDQNRFHGAGFINADPADEAIENILKRAQVLTLMVTEQQWAVNQIADRIHEYYDLGQSFSRRIIYTPEDVKHFAKSRAMSIIEELIPFNDALTGVPESPSVIRNPIVESFTVDGYFHQHMCVEDFQMVHNPTRSIEALVKYAEWRLSKVERDIDEMGTFDQDYENYLTHGDPNDDEEDFLFALSVCQTHLPCLVGLVTRVMIFYRVHDRYPKEEWPLLPNEDPMTGAASYIRYVFQKYNPHVTQVVNPNELMQYGKPDNYLDYIAQQWKRYNFDPYKSIADLKFDGIPAQYHISNNFVFSVRVNDRPVKLVWNRDITLQICLKIGFPPEPDYKEMASILLDLHRVLKFDLQTGKFYVSETIRHWIKGTEPIIWKPYKRAFPTDTLKTEVHECSVCWSMCNTACACGSNVKHYVCLRCMVNYPKGRVTYQCPICRGDFYNVYFVWAV